MISQYQKIKWIERQPEAKQAFRIMQKLKADGAKHENSLETVYNILNTEV